MTFGEVQLIDQAEGQPGEFDGWDEPRTPSLTDPHSQLLDALWERRTLIALRDRVNLSRLDALEAPLSEATRRQWAEVEAPARIAYYDRELDEINHQINELCARIAGSEAAKAQTSCG